MHGYDVYEGFLQFEIRGSWDRGSGPRVGPIWPYSINVLKNILLYSHIFL